MMTWLDWFCRMHSRDFVPPNERLGDPRSDLAMSVWIYIDHVRRNDPDQQKAQPIDFYWYTMLSPFVVPFAPRGALAPGAKRPPEPVSLVLTRATTALLAGAQPPAGDVHWKKALGDRHVYIDVPHGSVLVGDTLQLRALFARKMQSETEDQFLLIAVVTDRGSEQGRGRMVALLQRDGRAVPALNQDGDPLTELEILPPFTDREVEPLARERALDFLRLVLAYHFFGPKEVQETISATPSNRLVQGKPRKDESLFSMVRLSPARDRLGRPDSATSPNWSLTTRQHVSGHFKLQAHGPADTFRKLIWLDAYARGPQDAPIKPRAIVL
jgi:hypothetical protein